MSLAMLVTVVGQAIIIPEVHYGAGKHIGDLDPKVAMMGEKLNFVSQPFYFWGNCFVKLSVGFALLRIANTKPWRWSIISTMGE
jgi:hypothetical protein